MISLTFYYNYDTWAFTLSLVSRLYEPVSHNQKWKQAYGRNMLYIVNRIRDYNKRLYLYFKWLTQNNTIITWYTCRKIK